MAIPIRHPPHPRVARRIGAVLVAVAALATPPGTARAEPAARPSSLSWVRLPGAEACIGSHALALAVERRLQREVFVPPSRAAVVIEGRIERTASPPGFHAVLTVSNEAGAVLGQREIHSEAPACSAMDDDLALVIAVMIDPEAALAPPGSPTPRPPPPKPPAPPPAAPTPQPWVVSLQAGGVAMLGLMPRVAGGVLIRTHIEPPRIWAFEAGGVLFPTVASQPGSAGASFQIAEGFVSTCPLTLHAFGGALSACAGVQVGSIHAIGFGLATGTSSEQALFNVALEGRVRRRIVGPLVAAAGLGLVVPTVRSRFSYQGLEIFQMAPVAGALDLSVGVEFP